MQGRGGEKNGGERNGRRGRGGGRGRGRSNSGRGRGGRRNTNTNTSVREKKPIQSNAPKATGERKRPPTKPQIPLLKNGEKGAETYTVSEAERIRFTKILMDFREGEENRMEFPATLTNTERKFMHQLASQLGLSSKSTGKGDNRRIAVTKRTEVKKSTAGHDESYPVLNIGKKGLETLKRHTKKYPPTHEEELESKETGASLVAAVKGDNVDENVVATLNHFGLGVPNEAPGKQPRKKYVDLERRKASHTSYQSQKKANDEYSRIIQNRSKLPAFSRQEEIVSVVALNPVTVIQGETGCGKSTQCPQFLLDAIPTANIVVTQPRRISAISIAERVAQEQCLENSVGSLVGYQVRLDAASSKDTQLIFLTPGVLLRKLQSSPTLAEYSHIIIDEVHERDKYTEFLLITLRDLLPLRPDLRLILMSATLQTEVLVNYFKDYDHPFYKDNPPAQIEIEGRTFPVQEYFLEHVLQMTQYIDPLPPEDNKDEPMSMDELELELAKFTSIPCADITKDSLRCMMCGQIFADHIGLGSHVSICTGAANNEDTLGINEESVRIPHAAFDDYGDYDVHDTVKLEGYDFNFEPLFETENQADESEDNKWDGKGLFDGGPMEDEEEAQEGLLKQYQTMHDDEQIDTFLLLEVLHYINKVSHGDGAVLVFLPGWQEISEVAMLLEATSPFHNGSKFLILPLHSGIPSSSQRRVLKRPPKGVRKIVLSTNIAETSLTIDDIAFVIDTGRAKEKNYDPHLKTSTLQPTWISKASAKQRKGRAGRVKAGVCFHLFSRRRHQEMRDFVESELLRTPLEEMCLMTKKLCLAPGGAEDPDGIPSFLAKAVTPPHEKSVSNAIELLVDLGAMLPETNGLTELGHCLSVLSLEPRVGKMVIWSYLLGCARAGAYMGVAMSYKSPFILPPQHMRREAEKAQVELARNSESDQVTVLNIILKHDHLKKKSEGLWRDFCRRNFLSTSTMQMISDLRKNLTRELSSLNFPGPMNKKSFHNRHDNEQALWQAAISAGLYPNVATRKNGEVNFSTMTNRKAKVHISSVNAVKGQPLNSKCQIPDGEVEFVCFGEMVKGSHFFTLSQTTHLASPLPLLLLCGTSLSIRPDGENEELSILNLDDWIIFKCPTAVASRLVVLRKRLDSAFLNAISNPDAMLDNLTETERDAVEVLGFVLKSAHNSTNVR